MSAPTSSGPARFAASDASVRSSALAGPYRWLTAADRIGRRYQDVISGRCRLVAWGSGAVFRGLTRRRPLPIDYVVDSDPTRWGQDICGLGVYSPSRLRQEDPESTLVLVYSDEWPAIIEQAEREGLPEALPAAHLIAWPSIERRLRSLHERLATASRRPARRKTAPAIVVQGPVIDGVTTLVLQGLAITNPGSIIILSTWKDTPHGLLSQMYDRADEVVLSEKPAIAGSENRNLQIVSSVAGLRRAREIGAEFALRTRTDLLPLADQTVVRCRSLLANADTTARESRLRGRILVPSMHTQKHLLYHASKLVQFGHLHDLLTYWEGPLDDRTEAFPASVQCGDSLVALARQRHPAETFLGLRFVENVGRAPQFDWRASWAFYRDFFIVQDDAWWDLLWFRDPAAVALTDSQGLRAVVGHEWWRGLVAGRETKVDLRLNSVTFDEFLND